MIKETIQLWLTEDADTAEFEKAISDTLNDVAQAHHLGRNMEGSVGGGDYTLDVVWSDATNREVFTALSGLDRLDRVCYEAIGAGARAGDVRNTVWRTLLLQVKPGSDATAVQQFEQDLLAMPDYMQGIRRWALNRVSACANGELHTAADSGPRWTHVWQQEFQQVDDLLGEYLLHPYHWGWVDHYFDAEFPDCLVDRHISHNFCPLQRSLINETVALPLVNPVQE